MPHIGMRDAFGMMYRISTMNRGILQAWFDDLLPVLYPAGTDSEFGDPLITSVYPMDIRGTGFDWSAYAPELSRAFTIPRDPAKALAALDARRAEIVKIAEERA